jgi:hypothetical protein
MSEIVFAPDLVEEAVLLAERTMPPREARTFRRERDRVYDLPDPDRREAGFRSLHLRWFARLRLHEVVGRTLEACPGLMDAVSGCRVSRAFSSRDEGADLIAPAATAPPAGDARPELALRLRPSLLLDDVVLRACLRHELMHVTDMLDPGFGYERTLPASAGGPGADHIMRDRYRVAWDVSIDGRLTRAGYGDERLRAHRAREFADTFRMLGALGQSVFDHWFDRVRPTHARLVALARSPNGFEGITGDSGQCPLCRLPAAALAPDPGRMPPAVQALIRARHPGWGVEHGLCAQCRDLYEARHEDTVRTRH